MEEMVNPIHFMHFPSFHVSPALAHTNNSLMTSTAYLSIEFLIQEQFNSSTQVTALGQSLFIVGTAVGPLCLGPLSYLPSLQTNIAISQVVDGYTPAHVYSSPSSTLAVLSPAISHKSLSSVSFPAWQDQQQPLTSPPPSQICLPTVTPAKQWPYS